MSDGQEISHCLDLLSLYGAMVLLMLHVGQSCLVYVFVPLVRRPDEPGKEGALGRLDPDVAVVPLQNGSSVCDILQNGFKIFTISTP